MPIKRFCEIRAAGKSVIQRNVGNAAGCLVNQRACCGFQSEPLDALGKGFAGDGFKQPKKMKFGKMCNAGQFVDRMVPRQIG